VERYGVNMKIGIIGSGNLGTAMAADLARKNEVKIYTTKPADFSLNLQYKELGGIGGWESTLKAASNSYREVVSDAELILVALPTFLIKIAVKNILPYISKDAIVGFAPGAGGVEYLANDLIEEGITVFGFERVPCVSRLEVYGKIVAASKKKSYRIAALPYNRSSDIAAIIEKLFERPCGVLSNFIALTLTPTLHTSRLYDLYKDYVMDEELDYSPYFYREWRDSASIICFDLDRELHNVCRALTGHGIDASEVVPYSIHYESETPQQLTAKLRSIPSLNNILGPLTSLPNGKYILDLGSRYFIESFPYRLCIVKGLAELVKTAVPETDKVISWYCKLAGKNYYSGEKLCGKDAIECSIPQNYGFDSIEKLKNFYSG
jgi:hypothetical protein